MPRKPRLIVFASGARDSGGSGFENLVKASRDGRLNAEIVAVVSNHKNGGVKERADRLGIADFFHFPNPNETQWYPWIVKHFNADFTALSGWLKLVKGLDPKTTFNIHPGPLPQFGGTGLYGHHVHEAVLRAYIEKGLTNSAVSMHFVTEEYDRGPIFFQHPVPIMFDDTAGTLAKRVNEQEHIWQPIITDLVVNGLISWDGKDPASLKLPPKIPEFQQVP